jgi:hypothetical protein
MSYFEDASLVYIPSAVKDAKTYSIKPTDGSGDLTFSRGSDIEATRVNANGYIEKAKVNLLTYSNTFSNAAWVNDLSTETSGQAGYDGTNNAWLLTSTSAGGFIYQNKTISELNTFSVYAKAGSQIGVTIYSAHVSQGRYFNLSTGALGGTFVGTPIASSIDEIGGGWYRCSITVSATATNNFRVYVSNGTANVAGNIYIQDAQLNYGLVAQEYQETTTTSVVTGITNDLPRLDYSGGASCPSALLEPSRQNLFTNDSYFGGADWTKQDATITSNVAISPEGVQNASLYTTTSDIYDFVRQTKSFTSGTAYTLSVFAKAGTSNEVSLTFQSTAFGAAGAVFNLSTLAITPSGTTTGKIEDYGNGWFRCSATATATASTNASTGFASPAAGAVTTLYLYGAQLEQGSYPTSLIPTYGTSATRTADACSKTGISSLIGQTEGTLFLDITTTDDITTVTPIGISDGTATNRVLLYVGSGILNALVTVSGSAQATISSSAISANTRYKMAIAYKANDFAFYVNGALVGTDTNGTVPACSKFNYDNGSGSATFYGLNNQALLFKTRLTNAQLAELTTL